MGSEVAQDLDRFTQDFRYFDEHRQELLRRYPEQWVAVYNGEVLAAAPHIEALVAKLRQENVPPGLGYRGFITEHEQLLILPARVQ